MEENAPAQQPILPNQQSPTPVVIENQPVKTVAKKPFKIGLGAVLGMIVGILAFLAGVEQIPGGVYFLNGILFLLAGITVFPLVSYGLQTTYNIELSGPLKWFLFFILILFAAFYKH